MITVNFFNAHYTKSQALKLRAAIAMLNIVLNSKNFEMWFRSYHFKGDLNGNQLYSIFMSGREYLDAKEDYSFSAGNFNLLEKLTLPFKNTKDVGSKEVAKYCARIPYFPRSGIHPVAMKTYELLKMIEAREPVV